MRVLLVEPNYKNKYPPIGLMKISSYHKSRGDDVSFVKGIISDTSLWDRIYITTLFTFDYSIVIKTISHYSNFVLDLNNIHIGGILASLMPEKIIADTGITNVHIGTITNSKQLGYNDNINVDTLPLDYSILYDIEYTYASGDNFIAYTTRGCVNKCEFCAVPILEKKFLYTNNIIEQISHARENYGDKKDLLLLDNNILGMPINRVEKLVHDLLSLGFTHEPTFIEPSSFVRNVDKVKLLEKNNKPSLQYISIILQDLTDLVHRKNLSQSNRNRLKDLIGQIESNYDDIFEGILDNYSELRDLVDKALQRRVRPRYIDFNQGLDAREIVKNPSKVELLSNLPLRPFRVAFDNLADKEIYVKAIRIAHNFGINYFSNYLLYNYDDHPQDLYNRLLININLADELNCDIYSFPMKYSPIKDTNRLFIGDNWTRHQLSSFRAILNVTKGVVPKGTDFFYRAYGKTPEEFMMILQMPKDFIVYRTIFEELNYTEQWKSLYIKLSTEEIDQVLNCRYSKNPDLEALNPLQQDFLRFYSLSYNKLPDTDKYRTR